MNKEVFASKESDDWATPSFIYSQVVAKGYFDPCPSMLVTLTGEKTKCEIVEKEDD